jgi:hypothetical protein
MPHRPLVTAAILFLAVFPARAEPASFILTVSGVVTNARSGQRITKGTVKLCGAKNAGGLMATDDLSSDGLFTLVDVNVSGDPGTMFVIFEGEKGAKGSLAIKVASNPGKVAVTKTPDLKIEGIEGDAKTAIAARMRIEEHAKFEQIEAWAGIATLAAADGNFRKSAEESVKALPLDERQKLGRILVESPALQREGLPQLPSARGDFVVKTALRAQLQVPERSVAPEQSPAAPQLRPGVDTKIKGRDKLRILQRAQ